MVRTRRVLAAGFGSALLAAALVSGAGGAPAPAPIKIATGQDAGWPDVRGWDGFGRPAAQIAPWGHSLLAFAPYPTYQSGVRVAVGDVNGDGKAEIVTAPGGTAWTELRVFDGTTLQHIAAFPPFANAAWWNGAFVATGDTNGDGRAEIIDGLDAGCCTTIHVLDGVAGTELAGFYPQSNSDATGTRVAAADLNGDGKAEILAMPVGRSRVSALGPAGGSPFRVYEPFGADAFGGAAIAAGDVVGDARPELVVAAATSGGVQVKVIDTAGGTTLASLNPFTGPIQVTPEVAVGDVDGDGRDDIVVLARLSDGTLLRALEADGSVLGSFYVLDPEIVPGASLAAGDLDGNGTDEIVLGGGPKAASWPPATNGPDQRVAVYRLDGSRVGGLSAYPGVFQGGVRVALADVEKIGRPAIVTAPGPRLEPEIGVFSQVWQQGRDRGTRLSHFLAYESSFAGGVELATGYWLGEPRIVTAPGPGRAPEIRVFDPQGRLVSSFLAFEIVYTGGVSVAVGDIDADGQPEIVAGTLAPPARIRAFDLGGTAKGPLIAPFPPDGRGVRVGVADIAGTGRSLILAAETNGGSPLLQLIDPSTGDILRVARPAAVATNGIRLGAGDLDQDGRDEILVTNAWGGDGNVRVVGPDLRQRRWFQVYDWSGTGLNVAAAPRLGLPLRAHPVTVRMVKGTRRKVFVARFHDVAGSPSAFRASIRWGDHTGSRGVVERRGRSDYVVRGTKRYRRGGRFEVAVTLSDGRRVSVARSTAVVRRPG